MANADEKTILGPPRPSQPPADEGERRRVADRLHKLMVARVAQAFIDVGEKVPQNLGKGLLPTSGIANQQKDLKNKGRILRIFHSENFESFCGIWSRGSIHSLSAVSHGLRWQQANGANASRAGAAIQQKAEGASARSAGRD